MKHYFSDVKAMEQEVDFWRPSLIVIDTALCEYYFKKAADFCKFKKTKKPPLASYAGGTWEIGECIWNVRFTIRKTLLDNTKFRRDENLSQVAFH